MIISKNKQNIIYYFLFCLSIFLINACSSKSESSKDAVIEAASAEVHSKDEIVITPIQFKAAQIVYGNFELKNLSEVITANGYTKVPPQNQADVSVLVNGVIKNINVIEGVYVKAGQTLATYQSIEYNNIRLQKAKLQQELQVALVSKDYLVLEYNRQKTLSDEEVNARKVFQKVASDLQAEKKKIETISNQITILNENIQVGGNASSATIVIKAPISGYVTAVNTKIGSSVSSNTVIFSIINNAVMHVDILVYEKDLFKVAVGQQVRFVLTNQGNAEIKGKIFLVGKAFENETKAVAVHADIDNKDARLISGMYVNALIDIGAAEVNTLPQEAVLKADGKEYIFISQDEKKETTNTTETQNDEGVHFKRVEVKTGVTQFGSVQVTPMQEIPKQTKIVIKGAYYLQSAMVNSEEGGEH